MRTWRLVAFLAGVTIALAGLAVGFYFNQSIISIGAVLVAVFTALSPTIVPTLSDEIQANNVRYDRHRAYVAAVILPQAGSMELVPAETVAFLPAGRIAWRIGLDKVGAIVAGRGEDRIPAYMDVLLPHLEGEARDAVWRRFKQIWFEARSKAEVYTEARRKFDGGFYSKLDGLIQSKIGDGYEANWESLGIATDLNGLRKYNAYIIRDRCERYYRGLYSKPGWTWQHPAIAEPNMRAGAQWAVTEANSSMPLLWGGSPPENLQNLPGKMDEILDLLRYDTELKAAFEGASTAEIEAKRAIAPLQVAAEDASHLLGHGPDIPGECSYCRSWKPRF